MPTLTRHDATELFRRPPDDLLDVGAGAVAHRRVGSGPDVLFVHGWPVTGATFRTLLPELADHVTCHVLDLVGTGSSRFDAATPLGIDHHIEAVRRSVDLLGLDYVAVVGHDSGGLIARHALAGDGRLRAMGLIDTEQSSGMSWRFRSFLLARHAPGFARSFRALIGNRRLRRSQLVLGGAFADPVLLDGEFDELFVAPLRQDHQRLDAAVRLLRSFDRRFVDELAEVHARIDVPVQLVWGADDPFFPVAWAEQMVGTFPDARLAVIPGTRLFCHEERPAEVAEALLPVLTGRR